MVCLTFVWRFFNVYETFVPGLLNTHATCTPFTASYFFLAQVAQHPVAQVPKVIISPENVLECCIKSDGRYVIQGGTWWTAGRGDEVVYLVVVHWCTCTTLTFWGDCWVGHGWGTLSVIECIWFAQEQCQQEDQISSLVHRCATQYQT